MSFKLAVPFQIVDTVFVILLLASQELYAEVPDFSPSVFLCFHLLSTILQNSVSYKFLAMRLHLLLHCW